MLSRFHSIPQRNGRMDGRTNLLYQYRASVCWRAIKTDMHSIDWVNLFALRLQIIAVYNGMSLANTSVIFKSHNCYNCTHYRYVKAFYTTVHKFKFYRVIFPSLTPFGLRLLLWLRRLRCTGCIMFLPCPSVPSSFPCRIMFLSLFKNAARISMKFAGDNHYGTTNGIVWLHFVRHWDRNEGAYGTVKYWNRR